MAVVSVSRPWLMTSRPLAAASAARSRPSRAFSPRNSRVSRPVAGAYSSATAAPATAPRRNASRMLPAPAPSSLAISASRPQPRTWSAEPHVVNRTLWLHALEDAHFHVQVFLRILLDRRRSAPADRSTAPFMFSYNCLSFSNCPAVPSPSFNFVTSWSSRSATAFSRLKSVASVSSLPAVPSPRFSRSVSSWRFAVAPFSDFANASSFSSLPRLPSPALICARHRPRCSSATPRARRPSSDR